MATEKEAMLLVCPILEARSHLRVPNQPERNAQPCIGSKCAMWRWERQAEYSKKPPVDGYCGMGGKP